MERRLSEAGTTRIVLTVAQGLPPCKLGNSLTGGRLDCGGEQERSPHGPLVMKKRN